MDCTKTINYCLSTNEEQIFNEHLWTINFTKISQFAGCDVSFALWQITHHLPTLVYLILLPIIGRFYRCSDLHRLVELILLSYTRQPVDFIMHHFDVLQMADQFREFRRMPPLIEHIGAKSTIDVESVYIHNF